MRQIDRSSRVPPWQQIAGHLRAEIKAGVYDPDGPPLPSGNRLGQEWDVAKRTALKALRSLAAEGLIEPVNGLGYYVTRR